MLKQIVVVLIGTALSGFVGGCSKGTPSSEKNSVSGDKKESQRDNKEEKRPLSPSPIDPKAAEFVEKLKEAFDSWSRGETIDQFRKMHPEIQVFEPSWALGFEAGDRLTHYQVVSARPLLKDLAPAVKRRYELVVSLEIQEGKILGDGNKVRKSNKYKVQENKDDTWLIFRGKDDPAAPAK